MDMRHLQYFLEVVRHNSFTKAAQSMYITQPTISKMIQNLEKELDVTLFERIGKRVELTDAGRVFLSQAQMMVKSFQNMMSQLEDLTELRKGTIRIGLPPMIGAHFFPKVIGQFKDRYPGITLHLFEDGAKKVEEDVGAGVLDIGVALLPTNEEIFDYFPFVKERLMLLVHPSHPMAERSEVSLIDLKDEKFLLFREDFTLHHRIIAECVRAGFQPNVIHKSSQWDFISEMVAENLGIALLPETICSDLDPERFRFISLINPSIPWHLAMIWRKDRYLSLAAREWIRFMQTNLQ